MFYCLSGTLFAVADNLPVMARHPRPGGGEQNDSLAGDKAYQVVSNAYQSDAPKSAPQFRWFVHPLGYAEAARVATPEENRRKGKSILEVMRNQGVGGVLGAGGRVDFAAEGYELVHRTAVYAPEPREKAMKMLVLLNEKDFVPQAWVPRDIATCSTLYADVLKAFDNFDSLFDELFGGGEKVWGETMYGLKTDPNGPHLDLRNELIAHLGHRITVLTDYHLPINTTSERLLFAVEATDTKAVQAAMEKWMGKDDPTVRRHVKDGQIIWEMIEEENPQLEAPDIDFGSNMPAVAPDTKKKKKAEDDEEQKKADLLPHMAVTVWQGKLLIASHIDFLLKVIRPVEPAEPLTATLTTSWSTPRSTAFRRRSNAQVFSRTDEAYRPTYELIRQNKMPESESMLGRLLNTVFAQGKKGAVRHQKIDGSKLPDYQVVRRYLGPAGFKATTEADGWFLKGFTLSKNAETGASEPKKPAAEKPSAAKPAGSTVEIKSTGGSKAAPKKAKGAKADNKKAAELRSP